LEVGGCLSAYLLLGVGYAAVQMSAAAQGVASSAGALVLEGVLPLLGGDIFLVLSCRCFFCLPVGGCPYAALRLWSAAAQGVAASAGASSQ